MSDNPATPDAPRGLNLPDPSAAFQELLNKYGASGLMEETRELFRTDGITSIDIFPSQLLKREIARTVELNAVALLDTCTRSRTRTLPKPAWRQML